MRITPDTLAQLATLIAPMDTPDRRARYASRDIPNGDRVKDIDRRYRWDLFYAVKAWKVLPDDELADAHIDTALRRIVPML